MSQSYRFLKVMKSVEGPTYWFCQIASTPKIEYDSSGLWTWYLGLEGGAVAGEGGSLDWGERGHGDGDGD